jgi:DNA-binding NarL/FixJ family response regulator
MLRILVADSHPVVRAGIKSLLATTPDMRVEAEASNGIEIGRMIFAHAWDELVLDISAVDRDGGLGFLSKLNRLNQNVPVLVLSPFQEDFGVHALRAGADGYLSNTCEVDEFLKAIRLVGSGGRYVSPDLAQSIAKAASGNTDRPLHWILSTREFEIFQKLTAGYRPTEIAGRMNLSVKTVSTYRSRILVKLQLRSNFELVDYAARQGFLSVSPTVRPQADKEYSAVGRDGAEPDEARPM